MAASTTAAATSSGVMSASAGPTPTPTPSVSVLYVTIKPLMDTFTPPASCGEMHLTQLSSPGYQIWLNEPQPVTQSKFGDCYPPGFIDGYTSLYESSSSIAPMYSPLVCPQGWTTAKAWTNGYIACCASGFLLHPPDTTIDENRPAYGGTCYSNFEAGQTVKVTAYNDTGVTATVDWVASAATDQAFAHLIDGFQLAPITSADPASTASETQTPSPSPIMDASQPSHLSGGGIAGAVIGSVIGFILILMAVFFIARRYRQNQNQNQNHQQQQQQQAEWDNGQQPISPDTAYSQSPYHTKPVSPYTPYNAGPPHELGNREIGELDSGWTGRELESGYQKI